MNCARRSEKHEHTDATSIDGDVMIPETLDGWNLEVVRAIVEQGVFETDRFDFKEQLPHKSDTAEKLRLTKTCAAFANSHGGFLVFGVKDDKKLPPAERVVGVPASLDLPEHFGTYPSACEPSLAGHWTFKNNPPIALGAGRVIHVVHLVASRRRPHGVFEGGRWWFCKRTNKGTEHLSYAELQSLFVDAEQRISNLRLLLSELHRVQRVAEQQRDAEGQPTDQFQGRRYNLSRIEAVLPNVFGVLLPHSWLVRHLDAVRNAALEADTWLSAISPFAPLHSGQQIALRKKVASDGARVFESATNAIALLEKVLT
jgi:hypothetical protein